MKITIKILALTFLVRSIAAMEQPSGEDMQIEETKSTQTTEAQEIPALRDLVIKALAQFYSQRSLEEKNEFTLKAITTSRPIPFELFGSVIKGYIMAWPFLSDKHKVEVIPYFISCSDKIIPLSDKLITIHRFCMNPSVSKENKCSFLSCCNSYVQLLGKKCQQLKDKENKTSQEEIYIKSYEEYKQYIIPLVEFFLMQLNHQSSFSWPDAEGYGSAIMKAKNIEHFNVICEPTGIKGTFPSFDRVTLILKPSFLGNIVFQEPYALAQLFALLGDEFYTALYEVAKEGNPSMLEFLAKQGKLGNLLNEKSVPLLLEQALSGWAGENIVCLVLSNGWSPLLKDKDGQSFLYKAIVYDNIKVARVFVEFLLKQYSSCLNLPEELKDLQAFIAIIAGDSEAVCKLITQENINTPLAGTQHVTPLWVAVQSNSAALVTYLLNEGADIAIRDENDQTLLHQAAKLGYTEVLKAIIVRNGIDINVQDYRGYTPLFSAVEEDWQESVRILLENSADATIPDNDGSIPLEEANKDNKTMIELLRAATPHAADISAEMDQ